MIGGGGETAWRWTTIRGAEEAAEDNRRRRRRQTIGQWKEEVRKKRSEVSSRQLGGGAGYL
jgi:hypothetical protein